MLLSSVLLRFVDEYRDLSCVVFLCSFKNSFVWLCFVILFSVPPLFENYSFLFCPASGFVLHSVFSSVWRRLVNVCSCLTGCSSAIWNLLSSVLLLFVDERLKLSSLVFLCSVLNLKLLSSVWLRFVSLSCFPLQFQNCSVLAVDERQELSNLLYLP